MKTQQIEVRVLEEQTTAAMLDTITVDQIGGWLPQAFGRVGDYLSHRGLGPAGMPYARLRRLDEDRFQIEAGFPSFAAVEGDREVTPSHLPACRAAVATHIGPYEELLATYEALTEWLAERGKEAIGDPWEVYFSGPEGDPAHWRTEVFQAFR